MTFLEFARNNVLRDKESYVAYWLSSVFTVIIFFVFSVDRYHPELKNGAGIEDIMSLAQVAILIFSFGFLTLSIYAFVRKKRRTYGALLMMGMTRGQLRRTMLLENLLIGGSAIAVGMTVGLVVGQLTVMAMAHIIHLADIRYVFPAEAIRDTVIGFLAVFLAVSLMQARNLSRKPIVELLSAKQDESEGVRFHPVLAVVGVLLLACGYGLTFVPRIPGAMDVISSNPLLDNGLVPAVFASVLLGLFLLFREFTFLFLTVVQRTSPRYLKDGNALWVSGLKDKLKSSATTMFVSTVLLTMAFSAIIVCVSLVTSVREDLTASYPAAIAYLSYEGNDAEETDAALIARLLDENGVDYDPYRYDVLEYGGDTQMFATKFVRAADYNHQMGTQLAPGDGQAISIDGGDGQAGVVEIPGADALEVVGQASPILDMHRRNHSYVVGDATYEAMRASGRLETMAVYEFQADDEAQQDAVRAACRVAREQIGLGGYEAPFVFLPRIEDIDMQEYGYELLTYVSILLSLIFMAASASLLYFRLMNDVRDNLPVARNLFRFGLSVPQILKVQARQLKVLFALPLAFAVVSTGFAMNYLVSIQSASANLYIRALVVVVPLVLAELVYFALLNRSFESKVRNFLAV